MADGETGFPGSDDTDDLIGASLFNDAGFRRVFLEGLEANSRGEPYHQSDRGVSPDVLVRRAERMKEKFGHLLGPAAG